MAENWTKGRKVKVELGPLFSSGVLLLVYGLLRRRALAVGLGLGAIWADQRTEVGRALKERVKAMSGRDQTGGPS